MAKPPRLPLRLVAALNGDDLAALLEQTRWERPDVVEIRLDHWGAFLKADCLSLLNRFKKKIGIPFMLSFRAGKPFPSWWQEGWWKSLSMIDWIDVEWNAAYPWKKILPLVKQTRAKIIISHHDFKATLPFAKLDKIAKSIHALNPDVMKFATLAQSESDVHTLLELSKTWSAKREIAVMAMGPHATVSRLAAPLFGSCLIYGFVGKQTAKGQLPFGQLRDHVRAMYPRYNLDFQSRFK